MTDEEFDAQRLRTEVLPSAKARLDALRAQVSASMGTQPSAELAQLRNEIEQAKTQMVSLKDSLGAAGNELSLKEAEHQSCLEHIAELEQSAATLATLQEIEAFCAEVDAAPQGRLLKAAEACSEMVKRVRSISAARLEDDPESLWELKAQVHQRHALLEQELLGVVSKTLLFRPKVLEFHERVDAGQQCQGVSFADAWETATLLGLREVHLQRVAKQVKEQLLAPLFAAAQQGPVPRVYSPIQGHHVWTWAEEASDQPPVVLVCAAIEALIAFLAKVFPSDALLQLGPLCWPRVVEGVGRLALGRGQDVERLEVSACVKCFIPEKEHSLSRLVHDRLSVQKRAEKLALLASIRDAVVKEDDRTLEVENELVVDLDSYATGVYKAFWSGPRVSISACCKLLADTVRALPLDADLEPTVEELVGLYLVCRPHMHQQRLRADPRFCALFVCDCVYLSHQLCLLPLNDKERSGQFLHLVCELRRCGDAQLSELVRAQQAELAAKAELCCLERASVDYRNSDAAAGALLAATHQFLQGLSTLPPQVLTEVQLCVLESLGTSLLQQLLPAGAQRRTRTQEDVACAAQLVSRIVEAIEVRWKERRGDAKSKTWEALALAAQLAAATPDQVRACKAELLELLSPEQMEALLDGNPCTRQLELNEFREQRFTDIFALMAR